MAGPMKRIFKTDKKIRLGVWGLGRGSSFFRSCELLNYEIVAGCDFNAHMRDSFHGFYPKAFVTAEADKFLAQDFDAVLLATFCPAHADDAIACLKAGKHVVSEVTSFHTMAEGVRLVEAVEQSKRVYNLAENYPYSAANMWLARRWKEGLFGKLMYAEYEYVHECLSLAYTYIDGHPIVPGNQVHNWRSWINYHYYNTHSLGPVMHITGTRPTRVVALPTEARLAGYLMKSIHGMGGAAPSLIHMSDGGVMRNLMGATTNDGHVQRLWGTRGSAQIVHGTQLRLGGAGNSPLLEVTPSWDDLGEFAAAAGHGGGDFWVMYYFARQILEGIPAPFDVYSGADCTIPGILAYRSQVENGKAFDVPDFRDPRQREAYRNDHYAQPRYDTKNGLFPKGADESLTLQFSETMRDMIHHAMTYQAYHDWKRVLDDVAQPRRVLEMGRTLLERLPALQKTQKVARQIVDRYPDSDGARVLQEMLDRCEEPVSGRPGFAAELERELRQTQKRVEKLEIEKSKKDAALVLQRRYCSPFVTKWQLSALQPKRGTVAKAPYAGLADKALQWQPFAGVSPMAPAGFVSVYQKYTSGDGIAYLASKFTVAEAGAWELRIGHDGGVKVFVDGKSVLCRPKRVNPAVPDRSMVAVKLGKGAHEIVVALDTDHGQGWGIFLRFALPKSVSARLERFPVQSPIRIKQG
ncbi:MAG: hypothetical protein HY343_06885 [Lentisphaerae bacterium]|nr:hypothetical protein [Lentisphaerota bacterium]